jgi:hypothetical protein
MPADSFTGPSCKDLVEFMKSIKDVPAKHKGGFGGMSKKAIETVCDLDVLHVWESGDDIDDFLHLTQVIVKLQIEAEKHEGRRRKEPATVIISSEQGMALCTLPMTADINFLWRQERTAETALSGSATLLATWESLTARSI